MEKYDFSSVKTKLKAANHFKSHFNFMKLKYEF